MNAVRQAVRQAESIVTWALEEGFDRAGIADLRPSDHGDAYLAWLDNEHYADMEYLKRRIDARLDPSLILDEGASVLCVAQRYAPLEGRVEPAGDLWPRVAKYAHGKDYHDVMVRRLRSLSERIVEHFPGTRTRWYVDTGPVLERELAARAGLGVVGKNTCLLDRDMGSYFLLGELFLTRSLPSSNALTDLCGKCTLCLDACPTDALLQPYELDANRCISYWTIEHRGPLTEEAREMVGDWVFGCDICQDVCPWNRRRLDVVDRPEFELPARRGALDLIGLLLIDRDEYVEAFRGSPMKRSKQGGLQRNAAAAMGNLGDERYVPALAKTLAENVDVTVRDQAAWSLGRIAGDSAKEALQRAKMRETEPLVTDQIDDALRRIAARTPAPQSGDDFGAA